MRLLLWLIVLFGLATGLSLFVHSNNGYALLFLPPWRVELSLNAFILIVAGLLLGGYSLVRSLDWIVAMPIKVRQYRKSRREALARKYRTEALTAMLEGRFHLAERAVRKTAEVEHDKAARQTDLLIGAFVANQSRDFARRDAYLEEIREASAGRSLALAMLEAEMFYGQYRNREALEAIERALSISPKLTAALKLELKIRQQEKDPVRVLDLTEQLERSEALDPMQAARIRAQARLAQLQLEPMDDRELTRWWNGLGTAEKLNPLLATAASKSFLRVGDDTQAEALLVNALEHVWDARLIDAYGALGRHGGKEGDAVKRLARAEGWLQRHPDDHVLLLALARLCVTGALWGKARTYLEASVAVSPTPVALAELGHLLEQLGEMEAATDAYRQSLGLALDALEKEG